MTIDGITLGLCAKEQNRILAGAKVQKVLMPLRDEVVLSLYSPEAGSVKLCISADAGNCAVYLTKCSKPNPKTPSAFCMLLRKYIGAAKLTGVEQSGLDRVIIIRMETKDELMRPVKLMLIAEVMGKYSNIILAGEEGRVIDSVKRVSVDVSSRRQILPGCAYTPPPTEKYNMTLLSETSAEELLSPLADVKLSALLMSVFEGISAQTAEEILCRAGIDDCMASELTASKRRILAKTLKVFFDEALASPKPCVQLNGDGVPVFLSPLPYAAYPQEARVSFESCNEAADAYYTRRYDAFTLKQKKERCMRALKKHITKLDKKIKIYMEGIEEAKKVDMLQRRGEYITANIYRLKKGMSAFETADYETGKNISVALDKTLTPAQNAQKLFKKASKLKTALKINTKQLKIAEDEREFLESSALFCERAASLKELEEISALLTDEGYFEAPKKPQKKQEELSEPEKYTTPSGFKILAGKNDRQNDRITMGTAAKSDIWFHAKNIPGSHVLLITEGKTLEEIDDESVLMAAGIAAAHSKAKQSSKIPVDYTYRKNVKKPPSSRPGKVIYDDYFTVYVEPYMD